MPTVRKKSLSLSNFPRSPLHQEGLPQAVESKNKNHKITVENNRKAFHIEYIVQKIQVKAVFLPR